MAKSNIDNVYDIKLYYKNKSIYSIFYKKVYVLFLILYLIQR